MKAFSLMPIHGALNQILDSHDVSIPITASMESERHIRPVEIKRFIRNLRQKRQYSYAKDFVH